MNPIVVQTNNIPFLFDSALLVFNTVNDHSKTFYFAIEQAVVEACEQTDAAHSRILNCCFKGGWTPRHHRNPESGVHAIQMEVSQLSYMHERWPWDCALENAADLRPFLKKYSRD